MSLFPDWTVDRGVYPRWVSVAAAVKRFVERVRLKSVLSKAVTLFSRVN